MLVLCTLCSQYNYTSFMYNCIYSSVTGSATRMYYLALLMGGCVCTYVVMHGVNCIEASCIGGVLIVIDGLSLPL